MRQQTHTYSPREYHAAEAVNQQRHSGIGGHRNEPTYTVNQHRHSGIGGYRNGPTYAVNQVDTEMMS
jgi:hypothetical protein